MCACQCFLGACSAQGYSTLYGKVWTYCEGGEQMGFSCVDGLWWSGYCIAGAQDTVEHV